MFWTIGTAIFLVALAAYAIILMYIFPLLARFDNTIAAMFKNSIFIGMRFLMCTALMAVIYFTMLFVVIHIFTPAVIFGEGLCALLCSYLLSNILLMCQEQGGRNRYTESSCGPAAPVIPGYSSHTHFLPKRNPYKERLMLQAQKKPEKNIHFQAEGHPFMQSLHGRRVPGDGLPGNYKKLSQNANGF